MSHPVRLLTLELEIVEQSTTDIERFFRSTDDFVSIIWWIDNSRRFKKRNYFFIGKPRGCIVEIKPNSGRYLKSVPRMISTPAY